jgi:hypothetical protein
MADTVDPAASLSPADDADEPREAAPAEQPGAPADDRSVTELFEQLGFELSELSMSEGRLEAARNLPEVRRSARDLSGALIVIVAALTGFAFLNVAAVDGLSSSMSSGLAALVLAALWLAVASVLLFGFMARARRWLLWIVLKVPPTTEAIDELERRRDAAGRAARSTLEQLGPALAVQIALAAVPKAGEVADDVATGVVEVADTVLEVSDETVEVLAEQIPGGGMANQVWDVALMPGRLGVRVATTVLRRGRPAG